jgi:hypothetical protein
VFENWALQAHSWAVSFNLFFRIKDKLYKIYLPIIYNFIVQWSACGCQNGKIFLNSVDIHISFYFNWHFISSKKIETGLNILNTAWTIFSFEVPWVLQIEKKEILAKCYIFWQCDFLFKHWFLFEKALQTMIFKSFLLK